MNPKEEQLDDFWRELKQEMIPDTITLEEATRRMNTAVADPLPEAMVRRIVARATAPGGVSEAIVRPRYGALRRFTGLRTASQFAAAGTITALLLGAGLAIMLWDQDPTHLLGFDRATQVLTDGTQPIDRRMNALVRTFTRVRYAIRVLREVSAAGGELGGVADEMLSALQRALDAPNDVPMHLGTQASLEALGDVAVNPSSSTQDRSSSLRSLGQEAIYGVSCLAAGLSLGGSAEFESDAKLYLSKLQQRVAH